MVGVYENDYLLERTAIHISGSKSESNRLLILKHLYPTLFLSNLSNSDDTAIMQKILKELRSTSEHDVGHAGTAMRFLTALFAMRDGDVRILTGSKRMCKRPIKPLVDALRDLGADIEYLDEEGFPPLKISGKKLYKSEVSIMSGISSQFISALLLIAPKLKNGLTINLEGKPISVAYIDMTLSLLKAIGVQMEFSENKIKVLPMKWCLPKRLKVESDWSSASYWFSLVAMCSVGSIIDLYSFKQNSRQGDVCLVSIYEAFGVKTYAHGDRIILEKVSQEVPKLFAYDLSSSPDIAQTIAVTCLGLGVSCQLKGLQTLKIKETDRLFAMKTELEKFNAKVIITEDSLTMDSPKKIEDLSPEIDTYDDHRMALAFAPLSVKCTLSINNMDVVSKSYPNFETDLKRVLSR